MSEFEDGFSLAPHAVPTGRHEEGREIMLVGNRLLSSDPLFNNLSVPAQYRNHPLIAGRYLYTLPLDLLNAVVASVGEEVFDGPLLTMERELSSICGDHSSTVGFWQGVPITYYELKPAVVEPFQDDLIRLAGLKPVAINHAMHVYQDRDVKLLNQFSRGYCGWLLTNLQFLDEHDALLQKHTATIMRHGTYHATLIPGRQSYCTAAQTAAQADSGWPTYVEDSRQFLLRWRLLGLAGPYLPMPAKPLIAGSLPLDLIEQHMDAGGVFYLPDTMPIPGREQLRGTLASALRPAEPPEHLSEWLNIVRADNMAKNKMDPYARWFELQHCWRILHERHGRSLSRKLKKVEAGFEAAGQVGLRQISSDLTAIRKRLGDGWLNRSWPLSAR